MEPYRYRVGWADIERMAEDCPAQSEAKLLVSVDWDFFLPTPDLSQFPDEVAEMLAAGLRFGLEEWFSKQRSDSVWRDLQERISLAGLDPEQLLLPDLDPTAFAARLLGAFTFVECLVADSHAWGAFAAARMPAGSELVSFDAHHDCGYGNYPGDSLERSRSRARERPSCDDWIQASLEHATIDRATIVYPDWRGDREWLAHDPTLTDRLYQRVRHTTWSQWTESEPREASLLIVRSSAYSPPYGRNDETFLELAEALFPAPRRCLDCDPPLGIRVGDQNACKPR